MVHILQEGTLGTVGSLRIVVPARPTSHKRAYVYCSTRGQRGANSEAFVVFLDNLSFDNYSASAKSIKNGLLYVQTNLVACKEEWNRVHSAFPIK